MKKFLNKFDGLWALPVVFTLFILSGYALQAIGGQGTGIYDMAFLQPLFLAVAVVVGISNFSVWSLYFTFRDLYIQIYKSVGRREYKALSGMQKTILALVVYFLFFFAILVVYLKLV